MHLTHDPRLDTSCERPKSKANAALGSALGAPSSIAPLSGPAPQGPQDCEKKRMMRCSKNTIKKYEKYTPGVLRDAQLHLEADT